MRETEFLIGRTDLDLHPNFYPDDLPSDWRFDYYSALFKALSLPIDTDEDLDEIFTDIQQTQEEFELVLSITSAQLTDVATLRALLATVVDYQPYFILFCNVDEPPKTEVMDVLNGYHLCFQSSESLALDLQERHVDGRVLSFNRYPVLYAAELGDERQMRGYLEEVASINTKTVLICPLAHSETLNKMRIIAELLGF